MDQIAQHNDNNQASIFWHQQMDKHPNLFGLLSTIGAVASFILNGHVIVWLGRWVIRVSGYVAETALLFAVLWITGTSVAPELITLFMKPNVMQYLVWLALVVLAIIPEIILANAIVNAVGHWLSVLHNRRSVNAWIWAIAFTVPTALFFVLTAITLNTLGANGGNIVKASASTVNLRVDAGWMYGLLELTYAGVKKFLGPQWANTPAAQPNVPTPDAFAQQVMPLLLEHLNGLRATLIADITPLLPIVEPVQYDHLVALLASRMVPEPVNYQRIAETVAPLLIARMAPEPVNYLALAQQLAPLVAPEPVALDYQDLANAVAPLLRPSFVEVHRTLIEEVKALVPQTAAVQAPLSVPQIEATASSGPPPQTEQEAVEADTDTERDVRLETAFAKLLAEGKKVSGRALSEEAHCNRKAATHWLQETHPEQCITKGVPQSQEDQERDQDNRGMAPEPEREQADVEPEPEPETMDVASEPRSETEADGSDVAPEPETEATMFESDVAPEPEDGTNEVDPPEAREATEWSQQPEPTTEEMTVVAVDMEPATSSV